MDSSLAQSAFVNAAGLSGFSAAELQRPRVTTGHAQPEIASKSVESGFARPCAAALAALAAGLPAVQKRRRGVRKLVSTLAVAQTSTIADTVASSSKEKLWRKYGKWGVHKFGGASLNDAELYKTCGELLLSQSKESNDLPTAAIVSAAGGMTDALAGVVNSAVNDMDGACEKLDAAIARQIGILQELVPGRPDLTDPVCANLEKDKVGVKAMLTAASQMRGVPPQMLELVAGLGEVWSAQTLSAYLKFAGVKSEWVDARDVLIVPDGSLSGLGEKGTAMDTIDPFWDETEDRLQSWWEKSFEDNSTAPFLVITGFVCSTLSGRPTTLKRSGSDYSATIFAKILGSVNVTFWKNVNGVYTADPRRVPSAFPISKMTFDEAMELAYFGGQVLHPSAMVPCIEERIPVLVRNVFNPSHPGTRVYGRGDAFLRWDDQDDDDDEKMPVKAITSIEKVSLVTISGASFLGTHGVAKRMMEALANCGVNVILTSQGSSEHSITVAVADTEGQKALDAVRDAFELEITRNKETRAILKEGLSIMAVIGEGMKNVSGISGRFFNALGRAKVNIVAIAQGSSERNISAVVSRDELSRALRAVHAGFTLSETTVAVGIIGSGMVGTELMRQFSQFAESQGRNLSLPAMKEVNFLNIETRAICDANKMLFAEHGVPLEKIGDDACRKGSANTQVFDIKSWSECLESKGASLEDVLDSEEKGNYSMHDTDLDKMIEFLDTQRIPHKVVIDCTASDEVADKYESWLRRGLHVVTPNKRAGAGPLSRYKDCLKTMGTPGAAQWHYEATVGAQLPVISMVHDLLQTGDSIKKVLGVYSGSMSFVFNKLNKDPSFPFSEAIKLARERGLTEPNPQQDLEGNDTARKALILGRELGLELEFEDVKIQSLIPAGLCKSESDQQAGDDLIESLKGEVDKDIAKMFQEASDKGELLFYSSEVDVSSGTLEVKVRSFPKENPPFVLAEAETVVQFVTDRFPESTPLVVRGPGAGAEVTASGVFASLLRLAKTLG
eukprot:TRINITY_DN14888_c0_g1_i3.p1 TRINITY_DN14888_c0_g1~~TRINITY_DN14888_c0_g1_i3.p1  ORF type:complete len:1013 (-),score=218.24 TRINITY_DN14888_c0_g1_i3:55-3093(-)